MRPLPKIEILGSRGNVKNDLFSNWGGGPPPTDLQKLRASGHTSFAHMRPLPKIESIPHYIAEYSIFVSGAFFRSQNWKLARGHFDPTSDTFSGENRKKCRILRKLGKSRVSDIFWMKLRIKCRFELPPITDHNEFHFLANFKMTRRRCSREARADGVDRTSN